LKIDTSETQLQKDFSPKEESVLKTDTKEEQDIIKLPQKQNSVPINQYASFEKIKNPVFEEIIRNLTIQPTTIMMLRFGYANGRCFEIEEIAETLNIDSATVRKTIISVLNLYKKQINENIDKLIESTRQIPEGNIIN